MVFAANHMAYRHSGIIYHHHKVVEGITDLICCGAAGNNHVAAKISTIEPQIDPTTRAIKVRAAMDNPERLLQPGMFARARVVLPPQPDVVTVPETAVDYTVYGQSVFLIQEDGKTADGKTAYKAVQTFVTAGSRQNGKVAIVKGLSAGDMVANAGQTRIFNGAAVVPSDVGGLTIPTTTPMQ